jgi:hypothetical protein
MNNSAAVFTMNSLPAAAQSKNPFTMTVDDLHPSQRTLANTRDVVAIVDGDNKHILSPTGDFPSAVKAVLDEIG